MSMQHKKLNVHLNKKISNRIDDLFYSFNQLENIFRVTVQKI